MTHQRRALITTTICVIILGIWVGGCQSQPKKKITQQPVSSNDRLSFLQSKIQVTPLIENWHYDLGEKIRKLYIIENQLLVETETNKCYSIDRKEGSVSWVYIVGDPIDFYPVCNESGLYILSKGKLHILVKQRGALIAKVDLSFAPSSPPFAFEKYVFIGGWDGFLYALNSNTGFQEWRYRIDGHIRGASTSKQSMLFFPGTNERVYAISATEGTKLSDWGERGIYQTLGANECDLVLDEKNNNLYIGSEDFNIYAVNWVTGKLRWKVESGGPVEVTPQVTPSTLYAVSRHGKFGEDNNILMAIDPAEGKQRWQIKDGHGLFFKGKYHDWISLKNNRIAAVHPEKGTVRDIYNFGVFPHNVKNTIDSEGYLATDDGWIFSLTEK